MYWSGSASIALTWCSLHPDFCTGEEVAPYCEIQHNFSVASTSRVPQIWILFLFSLISISSSFSCCHCKVNFDKWQESSYIVSRVSPTGVCMWSKQSLENTLLGGECSESAQGGTLWLQPFSAAPCSIILGNYTSKHSSIGTNVLWAPFNKILKYLLKMYALLPLESKRLVIYLQLNTCRSI